MNAETIMNIPQHEFNMKNLLTICYNETIGQVVSVYNIRGMLVRVTSDGKRTILKSPGVHVL